jgi:hypothetical protein
MLAQRAERFKIPVASPGLTEHPAATNFRALSCYENVFGQGQ